MKLTFSLAPLFVLVLCACTESGGYDETGDGIGQEFVEVEALEMDLAEKDEEIRRLKSAIRDAENEIDDVIRDVQMASYEAEAQNWDDAAFLAQEAADNLQEIRDALPMTSAAIGPRNSAAAGARITRRAAAHEHRSPRIFHD